MVNNADSLLDVLEIAMNTCCQRHNQCQGCWRLTSCMGLWDRAAERAVTQSFTCADLRAYIEEFNQLWKTKGKTSPLRFKHSLNYQV